MNKRIRNVNVKKKKELHPKQVLKEVLPLVEALLKVQAKAVHLKEDWLQLVKEPKKKYRERVVKLQAVEEEVVLPLVEAVLLEAGVQAERCR